METGKVDFNAGYSIKENIFFMFSGMDTPSHRFMSGDLHGGGHHLSG